MMKHLAWPKTKSSLEQNQKSIAIFLDLVKAFDIVLDTICLILEFYGISRIGL